MAGKIEGFVREVARFGYEVAVNGYAERIVRERFLQAVDEQVNIRPRFIESEKNTLRSDGAVICELGSETLQQLREEGKSFLRLFDGGERLLNTSTKLTEVAIYPQRLRFFVPNSNWKNFDRQLCMIYEDGKELRKRLRLPSITQIMPEAIDLAQIIFQHPEAAKYLKSNKYADREIRTITPVQTESDAYTARVKIFEEGRLDVTVCNIRPGNPFIWVPRIIVPRRHPKGIGNSLIL